MFSKKKKPKKLYPENNPNPNSPISTTGDFIMPSIVDWSGNSSKDMSPTFPPPPKTPSPTSKYPPIIPTTPDIDYPVPPSPIPSIPKTPSIDRPPPFTPIPSIPNTPSIDRPPPFTPIPSIPNTPSIDHPPPLPKTNKRMREENNDDPSSSKFPRIESSSPPIYPSYQPSQISIVDMSSTLGQINQPDSTVNLDIEQYWADIDDIINTQVSPVSIQNQPNHQIHSDSVVFPSIQGASAEASSVENPEPIPSTSSAIVYDTVFTLEELLSLSAIPLVIPPVDNPNEIIPPEPVEIDPVEHAILAEEASQKATASVSTSSALLEILRPTSKRKKYPAEPKAYPQANEDSTLTSDRLFEIMVYCSDCTKQEIYLDEEEFTDIPNIQHLLHIYNRTVISKHSQVNTQAQLRGYTGSIRRANTMIFEFLKQTYIKIYPAKKVLDLIMQSTDKLNCKCMLLHERPLKDLLFRLRSLQYSIKNLHTDSNDTFHKRHANRQLLFDEIAREYKKIYNLE